MKNAPQVCCLISNHAFVNSFAKKIILSKPFVIFATHSNRLTL